MSDLKLTQIINEINLKEDAFKWCLTSNIKRVPGIRRIYEYTVTIEPINRIIVDSVDYDTVYEILTTYNIMQDIKLMQRNNNNSEYYNIPYASPNIGKRPKKDIELGFCFNEEQLARIENEKLCNSYFNDELSENITAVYNYLYVNQHSPYDKCPTTGVAHNHHQQSVYFCDFLITKMTLINYCRYTIYVSDIPIVEISPSLKINILQDKYINHVIFMMRYILDYKRQEDEREKEKNNKKIDKIIRQYYC